jgi:hypothetical protein
VLEASGRAAVDIPAKIKRSPAKAAAVAGGAAFLALKGPQRVIRLGRRAVTGSPAPMPKSVLPADIDKHLRSLGDDGEKVRRVLEKDFLSYSKTAKAERTRLRTLLAVAVARPLLLGASKAAAKRLFAPSEEDFATRLGQIRERVERGPDAMREEVIPPDERPATEP